MVGREFRVAIGFIVLLKMSILLGQNIVQEVLTFVQEFFSSKRCFAR